nr:MAG TPA: hypothetical protein [Caudoviricetes sp.]
MAKWNESEHPRDDDGKFTDGTGGGRTHWITSKRDFSNVQANENDLQENGKSSNIKLSKQEWAQYYKIIGDEQHGDFVYHIGKIGRAVRLGNKMIFDNGSFENPKVTKIVEFPSNDAMNDVFSYFAERGDIE